MAAPFGFQATDSSRGVASARSTAIVFHEARKFVAYN